MNAEEFIKNYPIIRGKFPKLILETRWCLMPIQHWINLCNFIYTFEKTDKTIIISIDGVYLIVKKNIGLDKRKIRITLLRIKNSPPICKRILFYFSDSQKFTKTKDSEITMLFGGKTKSRKSLYIMLACMKWEPIIVGEYDHSKDLMKKNRRTVTLSSLCNGGGKRLLASLDRN